jgi:hypothetical protein
MPPPLLDSKRDYRLAARAGLFPGATQKWEEGLSHGPRSAC